MHPQMFWIIVCRQRSPTAAGSDVIGQSMWWNSWADQAQIHCNVPVSNVCQHGAVCDWLMDC